MQRSPELEALVASLFEAATRSEAAVVDTLISTNPGTCLIGSDPGEWLSGGEAVAKFLRGELTNAGGQARFSPEGTEAYEEGTVGWATTRLTITLPDGGHVSPRWSSVFHREGDTWRFVQTHASIGVGNDDVG
ncbi:nuclear transport factor 2 family protein [Arthrobacter sp. UYCu723]